MTGVTTKSANYLEDPQTLSVEGEGRSAEREWSQVDFPHLLTLN
jgi:hypothetical protein